MTMQAFSASNSPVFQPSELPFRPPALGDTQVQLWLLPLEQLPSPGVPGVTPDRHAPRLTRRFYLRLLLGAYLNQPAHQVKLTKTPSGKPHIVMPEGTHRPPLYFSLSHHVGHLLVAVCRQYPVGVDLESRERHLRQPMKLAKRYFHPSEYDYLKRLPDEQLREHWLMVWTCKEAVVKATGGGIVSGLDRFAVLPADDHPQLAAAINTPDDDPLHKLKLIRLQPLPGMLGALACAHAIDEWRAWRLQTPGSAGAA